MADTSKRDPQPMDEADVPATGADSKSPNRWWTLIRSPRWLSAVLVAFLVGQGATMVAFTGRSPTAPAPPPPTGEIPLGKFCFAAKPNEAGQISRADFALYVVLIAETEREALPRLTAHQYRIRQHIEELLRRAHSADFEDPVLGELKRQFQERINATLGMRAVGDVIIVDLDLARTPSEDSKPRQTAEISPPTQRPSGS